jgi:hypothetical protein
MMKAIERIKGFIQAGNATESLLQDVASIEGLYTTAKALAVDYQEGGMDRHPYTDEEYSSFANLKLALRDVDRPLVRNVEVSFDMKTDMSNDQVAEAIQRLLVQGGFAGQVSVVAETEEEE